MHKTHIAAMVMFFVISVMLCSVNAQAPYDRYVYGDNKGSTTIQSPRPQVYALYVDTSDTCTGVANATDSSYQGATSWLFGYNLADWDTSLTPDGPKNYAGLGWYWLSNSTISVTGATHLRFAYKMSNATHKLTVNLMCLDLTKHVCSDSVCSDTSAATCPDSLCKDSTFASRTRSYVLAGAGGTGTAGRAGWKLDSIPLSAWGDSLLKTTITGVQFMITYLDTNVKTSPVGTLRLDEICFPGVTEAVKSPLILPLEFGNVFKSNGVVRVSYYSIQGREISSVKIRVKAGQSCAEVLGSMPEKAAGAYLVKVKGAGVNVSSKLIK